MTKRLDFRADIEAAAQGLALTPGDFRLLNLHEYESILISIVDQFTTLGKKGVNESQLWNFFREPRYAVQLDYAPAFLKALVPLEETVWFVTEDWYRTKQHGNYWVYEGKIGAIAAVLGELWCIEYYIVSKKFEWLLCENHHDILIAVGQPMIEKLAFLTSQ